METQTHAQALHHRLEAWLAQLPVSDLPQKLHLLETKLNELTHQGLSPMACFHLLELFLPVMDGISEESQRLYADPSPHKAAERFHHFGHCQNLLLQLAMAYGIAINSTLFEESTLDLEQLQCDTLHRAMQLLLQVQYNCYGAYHPMPTNLWSCLHQFYFLAEKKQLLRKKTRMNPLSCHDTIDLLYKEALLLATAQLNQLQHTDLKEAFTLIPSLANTLTLTHGNEGDRYYHVHLDLDEPPLYTALEQRMTDPVTTRFFHCQHLLPLLKNTKVEKHLKKAWRGFQIRRQPRMETDREVVLSYGFYPGYLNLQEQETPRDTWTITNSSAKGFHLESTKAPIQDLAAETLITYKSPAFSTFAVWSMGTIRWIKQATAYHLEMGIETLAHSALPVEARKDKEPGQPAILLLGSLVNKRPNSILFPTDHPWKEGHCLRVQHSKVELTIRLTCPCGHFLDCEQFGYEVLATQSNSIGWRHITYQDIEGNAP